MKSKLSVTDSNFNKNIVKGGEIMTVSEYLIKGDSEAIFILAWKLDKKVKGISQVSKAQE